MALPAPPPPLLRDTRHLLRIEDETRRDETDETCRADLLHGRLHSDSVVVVVVDVVVSMLMSMASGHALPDVCTQSLRACCVGQCAHVTRSLARLWPARASQPARLTSNRLAIYS